MNNMNITKYYKVMFPDYPDIVSVAQLGRMLGISKHLAYDLITQKKLKAFFIGNSYKIPKVCVIDYIFDSQKKLQEMIGTSQSEFDTNLPEKT